MKQQSLASQAAFEKYGRKSRRELFLDEMERVVPWAELSALVEPHYAKAGNGRRPVGLSIMLRTYFVQQWFNLSDPGVEEALYESAALRRFVGVDLGVAPAPDETTICRFRHLLEKHDVGGEMLEAVTRLKPRLHVFGHVHGAHGTVSTEDTLYVNAALLGPDGNLDASPIVLH